MAIHEAKGQFIPDLLLLQSIAYHPDELKDVWKAVEDSLSTGALPRQDWESDTLVAVGSWLHEFTHYLQFTTRIQGVEYYSLSSSLANRSLACVRELVRWSEETGEPFGLPLHNFAFNCQRSGKDCAVIRDWFDYWFTLNTLLVMGGWSVRPSQDQRLIDFWKQKRDAPQLFPSITYSKSADGNEVSETRDITSETVMEVEAIIVTTRILECFFPERHGEILRELHGWCDDNANVALRIMGKGLDLLVPLIADYSMQGSGLLDGERKQIDRNDFETHPFSCPWRFVAALDACERYAGISYEDFAKHSEEIGRHVADKLGTPNADEEIRVVVNRLQEQTMPGLSDAMQKFLRAGLQLRLDHKSWFMEPFSFFPDIYRSIWLPRVLFTHGGIPDGAGYVVFMFGPRTLEPEEVGRLVNECYYRWAGRELAMREGPMVCPCCTIEARRGCCDGQCHFAKLVQENIGVDPSKYWVG